MKWTHEKDAEILSMRQSGKSVAEIAQHFGVTEKAIQHRIYMSPPSKPASDKALLSENQRLKKQLEQLQQHQIQEYNIDDYTGEIVRFGAIADTHLGSLYENLDFLHFVYELFRIEGINVVYHAGDLVDGERMYKGQEYEIHVHGGDAQIDYAVKNYPQIDSIQTKFICGNHDYSFWKSSGFDVGKRIAEHRHDMAYLGADYADIKLKSSTGYCCLRLVHPSGGTAYAISYKSQKYIESLTGGEKPDIILSGHFHKAEYLATYRNVQFFQAGCIQKQTPFMRGKHTAAMVGVWIIELVLNDPGIARCKAEFIPWYAPK